MRTTIFKFDENGIKLSIQVENTVAKGEIARYEQFLLFPQCFQKACFPGASKGVIVWEWVKRVNENNPLTLSRHKILPFPKQDRISMCLQCKSFELTAGKREIGHISLLKLLLEMEKLVPISNFFFSHSKGV